ncbi:hypothetical protein ACVNPZ_06565 [Staphylococcus aureus]
MKLLTFCTAVSLVVTSPVVVAALILFKPSSYAALTGPYRYLFLH